MDISIQDEIKLKFRNGAVCPHCGSKNINKFEFFNFNKGIDVKNASFFRPIRYLIVWNA